MVDTAVEYRLIGMTIQTVGWIGAADYCKLDFGPGAVMTGGAGAVPVGWDKMHDFNLVPISHSMADTTGSAVGKIAGTQRNGMAGCAVQISPVVVAGVTGDIRPDGCYFIRDKIGPVAESDPA